MRIVLITPAKPGSLFGNRRTALRWASHLRALGHVVEIANAWDGRAYDAMIALHARRSHASLTAWKNAYPRHPLILVLTGTDLYADIRSDFSAQESLLLADRLIVLQPKGLEELTEECRAKAEVICQSVRSHRRLNPPHSYFLVSVIGHLREEKDPWRTALALRHLTATRGLRVVQIGKATSRQAAVQAGKLMRADTRYRWLGEIDHTSAMRWLARSHVMVVSSRIEGGAHVVSEAIALGVPVIASEIPGNLGLLGDAYPGYFKLSDERALAELLYRAINQPAYLASLQKAVRSRQYLVDPSTERQALATLLARYDGTIEWLRRIRHDPKCQLRMARHLNENTAQ
ncbi:MAG: selenoneine biosynthesis selenosugar synthase SenB [Sterolibacterium sp.]|nr:selenoneine biosynthesis selenosugar synthase SenB [Sterolibacterium sp.]